MVSDRKVTGQGARVLLTLLCLAQFMLILDVAVVAVAVPSIQSDLDVSSADIQWVSTAYGLAFGGFLVAAGRISDLFGPRLLLLGGLVVFVLASAACGFAPDDMTLFVARAVQGLGAALVSPAALSLVTTTFAEGEGRNKALGIWGAVASGGAIAGQLLGGVLTDVAGWRSIFLLNLPVGVVVMVAIVKLVPKDSERTRGSIDVSGATMLTAGFVLLVTAVTTAAEHGFGLLVLGLGAASVLMLAVFVAHEGRVAQPIVRLSMFRNPNVRYGNIISVLSAGGATVAVFLCTLYLQQVLGLSPMEAGLGFAPITALILLISLRISQLINRFGVRNLLLMSSVLFGLGSGLLCFVATDGSYWTHVLPGLAISGAGAALSLAPAMILCTTGVPDEEQGLASGLLSTSQQLGAALSLALLNAVVAAVGGGTDPAALIDGFRAGFLASLVIPVGMVLCVLALPKAGQGDQGGRDGQDEQDLDKKVEQR